ncbi:Sodium- and chloride-dependent GABA transporter 1 [Mucor velutinosus]|uniref:Sodium- and chloride-dependent GABA transporter 1 n=1 Tax=Mucor velutinosus TaxID=708070 RepID=A0AAN7I0P2_9FUNG|nr:Sodium- and chloride-dependent GABA transporter 1 [Mucor velutinosus]
MAISLLSSRASLLHDLVISGYYIGVARVDSFGPVAFLKVESEMCRSLPAVLQLILAGKLLMETSKIAIEQYKDQVVVDKKGITSGCIIPNFTSAPTAAAAAAAAGAKRRKKSLVGSSSQLP